MTLQQLDALNVAAEEHIAAGAFEAAESILGEAYDVAPDFYRTRLNLGLVAASQQQWEEALDEALVAAMLAEKGAPSGCH